MAGSGGGFIHLLLTRGQYEIVLWRLGDFIALASIATEEKTRVPEMSGCNGNNNVRSFPTL